MDPILFRSRFVYLKICGISIEIPAPGFVDTGIFKQIRGIYGLGGPFDTDHVCPKLNYSCRARICLSSFRDPATKVDICPSVVIYQHCRVKEPNHICAVRRLAADQRLS